MCKRFIIERRSVYSTSGIRSSNLYIITQYALPLLSLRTIYSHSANLADLHASPNRRHIPRNATRNHRLHVTPPPQLNAPRWTTQDEMAKLVAPRSFKASIDFQKLLISHFQFNSSLCQFHPLSSCNTFIFLPSPLPILPTLLLPPNSPPNPPK